MNSNSGENGGHLLFGIADTTGDPTKTPGGLRACFALSNHSMYTMGDQISGAYDGKGGDLAW